MKLKISIKYLLFYIITFIVVIAGDLLTKEIINTQMQLGSSYEIIPGFFNFTNVHNTGAAWGLLSGHIELFLFVALLAGGVIIYYFVRSKPEEQLLRFGLVLVFAGMLGNVYDRAVFQYVRDFIDFIILGYDFPIFNIADMGVVIGMFCIIAEVGVGEYKQWKFNQLNS